MPFAAADGMSTLEKLAISDRARSMPESPIRMLTPLADAAKARGTKVYHLNIGQPDIETPACIRDRLGQLDARVLEYSPSAGTPEFLRSLQQYYLRRLGMRLDLDQIVATTGGSEAILFSLMACTDQGDDILIVEPFYANDRSFAAMAGVNIVPVTSRGRDGFHLPERHVWERTLTPRSRLVLLCNPNNPTGTVYHREELDMVADFCREHGLFLVADEVYREFVYDGRRAISALELPGCEEMVVMVDSLSKRYSACGIRLGALVTRNRQIYDACLRMAQGRLSPPGLAQFIAVGAESLDDAWAAGILAEYQRRRDLLYDGLAAIPGVFLRKPEGAFYCVARLPVDDAGQFAAWLLTDFQHDGATVMVSPASGFYASPLGKSEVRIAYVLREEDLRTAVDLLRFALAKYSQR